MSARIDHYAKMLDALELAKKSTNADVSHNAALLAQVHATAYAAEQARIGNLISLVGFQEQLVDGVAVPDEVLYREIAERLALS